MPLNGKASRVVRFLQPFEHSSLISHLMLQVGQFHLLERQTCLELSNEKCFCLFRVVNAANAFTTMPFSKVSTSYGMKRLFSFRIPAFHHGFEIYLGIIFVGIVITCRRWNATIAGYECKSIQRRPTVIFILFIIFFKTSIL